MYLGTEEEMCVIKTARDLIPAPETVLVIFRGPTRATVI